jgi:hypothetical protein
VGLGAGPGEPIPIALRLLGLQNGRERRWRRLVVPAYEANGDLRAALLAEGHPAGVDANDRTNLRMSDIERRDTALKGIEGGQVSFAYRPLPIARLR